MLGSLISCIGVPEELNQAYCAVSYIELDEALGFSVYVGESENVGLYLDYWEEVLREYLSRAYVSFGVSEFDRLVAALDDSELVIMGLGVKKPCLKEGDAQFQMWESIKARQRLLDSFLG